MVLSLLAVRSSCRAEVATRIVERDSLPLLNRSTLEFRLRSAVAVPVVDYGWWPFQDDSSPFDVLSSAVRRLMSAPPSSQPQPLWLSAAIARQGNLESRNAEGVTAIVAECSLKLVTLFEKYGVGSNERQHACFLVLATAVLLFVPGVHVSRTMQACTLCSATLVVSRFDDTLDGATLIQQAVFGSLMRVARALHAIPPGTSEQTASLVLDASTVNLIVAAIHDAVATPSTALLAIARAANVRKLDHLESRLRRSQSAVQLASTTTSAAPLSSTLGLASRRLVSIHATPAAVSPLAKGSSSRQGVSTLIGVDGKTVLRSFAERLSSAIEASGQRSATATSAPRDARRATSAALTQTKPHLRRTQTIGVDRVCKQNDEPLLRRASRDQALCENAIVVGDARSFDGWARLPAGGGRLRGRSVALPEGRFRPTHMNSVQEWREYEEYLFVHQRASTGDETRRDLAKVFPQYQVAVRPVGELELRVLTERERGIPTRPSSC